jgi:FixJ family two-component response regulator
MCAVKPGFPVIFTTGYTAEFAALKYHLETGATFLQKPYLPQELGQMVRRTLDREAEGSPLYRDEKIPSAVIRETQ